MVNVVIPKSDDADADVGVGFAWSGWRHDRRGQ
jgi:hypothetical protein